MRAIFIMLLAPALHLASPVSAQTAVPAFDTLLSSPIYQNAVIARARNSVAWSKHNCEAGSFSIPNSIQIGALPATNPQGGLISGNWRQSVQASGCGIARKLNIGVYLTPTGGLTFLSLVPGETLGDADVQRQAAQVAFSAAMADTPDCRDGYIDDTELVGPAPVPRQRSAWTELWTLQVCSGTVRVEITYRPEGGGVEISSRKR